MGALIRNIYGLDIDDRFLEIASKNLSLLSPYGLAARGKELQTLWEKYGKDSHVAALSHLIRIRQYAEASDPPIATQAFKRNVLESSSAIENHPTFKADILLVDLPYGNLVTWSGSGSIDTLLLNSLPFIDSGSVIAVVHDKKQKRETTEFSRLEKFKVGKRVVEILRIRKSL